LPQNTGEAHRTACQQAIALFEYNFSMSSASNTSKERSEP
jgi:hypothetical protein